MHPIVFYCAVAVLTLCLAACAVLTVRSPGAASRILALDTLTVILIGLLALAALQQRAVYDLDAGLVLALLGFGGTLAAARFAVGKRPF